MSWFSRTKSTSLRFSNFNLNSIGKITSVKYIAYNPYFHLLLTIILVSSFAIDVTYRGADKSLARPGRKQATATEDFEFHISYL